MTDRPPGYPRTLRPQEAVARVALLDGFSFESLGQIRSLTPTAQRLLALVCLAAAPRSSIAARLWPDMEERRAQTCLRSTLWRVQRNCPGLLFAANGQIRLDASVTVDVHELTAWTRLILRHRVLPDELDIPGVALAGDLLPGWQDEWVQLEREYLRQLRMHALEVVADKLSVAGRHGEAMQAAFAAVRADPLRESAHRAVIRVQLAEGNRAEAIRHFETFRRRLHAELGVKPTTQITELIHGLRTSASPAG